MNGYADDLAAVIEALDLRDATLVGHSTGGGEVAHYIGTPNGVSHSSAPQVGDLSPRLMLASIS